MSEIYVIGAGGHGAVVAELVELVGYSVAGFIDDDLALKGKWILGWQVIGGGESVPDGANVALGVGDNMCRLRLLEAALASGWKLPVLIHPSAVFSRSAEIGEGTVLIAQATVNARAVIGRGCILNTACSVDHDCTLGDCAHIAPGARLAGGVSVGETTLVGIGSCIRPCISIGRKCTIGAGSVVVSDIPDGAVAFGNPARQKAI